MREGEKQSKNKPEGEKNEHSQDARPPPWYVCVCVCGDHDGGAAGPRKRETETRRRDTRHSKTDTRDEVKRRKPREDQALMLLTSDAARSNVLAIHKDALVVRVRIRIEVQVCIHVQPNLRTVRRADDDRYSIVFVIGRPDRRR